MQTDDTIVSFEATPLEAFACLADRALEAAACSCVLVSSEAGVASTFLAWVEHRRELAAAWTRAERAERSALRRWAAASGRKERQP